AVPAGAGRGGPRPAGRRGPAGSAAAPADAPAAPRLRWPGPAQGFEITRDRGEGRADGGGGARRLLRLVREHYLSESRLRYVREVAPEEGACHRAPPRFSRRFTRCLIVPSTEPLLMS